MGEFFVLFCVASLFVYWDLSLRIVAFFGKAAADRRMEGIMRAGPRLVFSLAKLGLGFRFRFESAVEGELPPRFLLIANHQSIVDIPVLLKYFPHRPLRFVAKKELEKGVPFVSLMLSRQRHCLIQRKGNMAQAMHALAAFGADARNRALCPVIFPEGTRSRSGELLQFHSAGVRKILEAESLPIVSVALDGGHRISTLGMLVANVRGSVYRVRVMGTYGPPRDKREINEILADARAKIEAQLAHWRAEGDVSSGKSS
jgi:1-acyl-sn-glycerol-3-phosphate acyltransferase